MKLITGYTEYTIGDLFRLGGTVGGNLTGSVPFADLKPTPVVILAATDALGLAIDMIGPGRKVAIAAAHATLAGLLAAVAMNAPQIPGVTDAELASIGLPVVKRAVRTTHPPAAPTNLLLKHGKMPSTVAAKCKNPAGNIRMFVAQWTLNPNGDTWTDAGDFTNSQAILLADLPRGKDVWIRVAAINSKGQGPWSDPATIMVI